MGSSFAINISDSHEEGSRVNVKWVNAGNDDKWEEEPGDKPQEIGIVFLWKYLSLGFAQKGVREVHLKQNTERKLAHKDCSCKRPPDVKAEYGFLESVGKCIGRNDSQWYQGRHQENSR